MLKNKKTLSITNTILHLVAEKFNKLTVVYFDKLLGVGIPEKWSKYFSLMILEKWRV